MVWTVKENRLLAAIKKGSISEINQAIQNGAKVNAKDDKGWTPLMLACENADSNENSKEVIELLIAKGADVNATDNDGWTPLMFACENEEAKAKEVIELLIAKGADVNATDNDGLTPLMHAIRFKTSEKVIELLSTKLSELFAALKADLKKSKQENVALKADLEKSKQENANLKQKIDEQNAQIAYNNFQAKKKEKQRMTNLMLGKYRHK